MKFYILALFMWSSGEHSSISQHEYTSFEKCVAAGKAFVERTNYYIKDSRTRAGYSCSER